MLTKDLIKKNDKLAGLTDEQIAAIETLSKNDEDIVVGEALKKVHDKYDETIKAAIGVDKPGGVKSYDHVENVLKDFKKKAEDGGSGIDQSTFDALKKENEELEEKIKKGVTNELAAGQIKKLEQQLKDKEDAYTLLKTTKEKELTGLQAELKEERKVGESMKIQTSIEEYARKNKIQYNPVIEEGTREAVLKLARKEMMNGTRLDYVEGDGGNKVPVLRNTEDKILYNENNNLAPYSPGEYFFNLPSVKGMLNGKVDKKGGGTNPPAGGGGAGGGTINLANVSNQIQADELIREHVMKEEGMAKTDEGFSERCLEIRTENKVGDLPMR